MIGRVIILLFMCGDAAALGTLTPGTMFNDLAVRTKNVINSFDELHKLYNKGI
jgi:hypothetical protein